MKNARLSELFGGKYRFGILRELYLNRAKRFSSRILAERAKADPGNTNRLLNRWATLGVVAKYVDGRNVLFQAADDPLLAGLTDIFLRSDSLLNDIRATLPAQTEVAVVFGSAARGEERADSDVDVLVLGPNLSQIKVNAALRAVGRKHQRAINASVYSREHFNNLLAKGDDFARNITSQKTIAIVGELGHAVSKTA